MDRASVSDDPWTHLLGGSRLVLLEVGPGEDPGHPDMTV